MSDTREVNPGDLISRIRAYAPGDLTHYHPSSLHWMALKLTESIEELEAELVLEHNRAEFMKAELEGLERGFNPALELAQLERYKALEEVERLKTELAKYTVTILDHLEAIMSDHDLPK